MSILNHSTSWAYKLLFFFIWRKHCTRFCYFNIFWFPSAEFLKHMDSNYIVQFSFSIKNQIIWNSFFFLIQKVINHFKLLITNSPQNNVILHIQETACKSFFFMHQTKFLERPRWTLGRQRLYFFFKNW